MESRTMNKWYRPAAALGIIVLLVLGWFAFSGFFARYYFVVATRGAHDQHRHEEYLRKALTMNPTFGYANLALARLTMMQNKYGAAMELQRAGMESFRPFRAYQQLGTIHERLGEPDRATAEFERSRRMYPNDVVVLERLAALAFRQRDEQGLLRHTDELLRYDLNNLNALYLRARSAEQHGNSAAAFLGYQLISIELSRIAGRPDRPLLFDSDEITSRLQILRPMLEAQ
jgi:tetratricopeptide (TPR) repeat protein